MWRKFKNTKRVGWEEWQFWTIIFFFRWPKNQGEPWFQNMRFINLSHNNFHYVSIGLSIQLMIWFLWEEKNLTNDIAGTEWVLGFSQAGGIRHEPQLAWLLTWDGHLQSHLLRTKTEKGFNDTECKYYWFPNTWPYLFNFLQRSTSLSIGWRHFWCQSRPATGKPSSFLTCLVTAPSSYLFARLCICLVFSCPGSSIPDLGHSLSGCHFWILTQRVTFDTWDPSDTWSEYCVEKR